MRFLRFGDWGIFQKVMSISVILNALIIVWAFFYLIPLIEAKLMEEKRNATKDVLDIAYTLAAAYEQRSVEGELTPKEAQRRALRVIKQLRYRDDDYFWINDLEPRMLMHPIFPAMDGKNLANDRDRQILVCRDGQNRNRKGGRVYHLHVAKARNNPAGAQVVLCQTL
jgi:methyl-accepting chemotaxis protein